MDNELIKYLLKFDAKYQFHASATQIYSDELKLYCPMYKFKYRNVVKMIYNRSMPLTAADVFVVSKHNVCYGDLYDYRTVFDELFKYKDSSLNDGVILNTLANNYKKQSLSKYSLEEITHILDEHIALIAKFNTYYADVQLIQQLEAM